jgi:hypothetical protein
LSLFQFISQVGYISEQGNFVELEPGQQAPEGTSVGYQEIDGVFHGAEKFPADAKVGYTDKDGEFVELKAGDKVPEGGTYGYMAEDGVFHASDKVAPGDIGVFMDEHGAFVNIMGEAVSQYDGDGEIKMIKDKDGKVQVVKVDKDGKTHVVRVTNPGDIVEVEIHDEDDLDENGKPKVKIVLRHRASIGAPKDAKDVEGGGKVWIEGDEEVTEMPYYDKMDLDENGQPKLKRMRVRKRLDSGVHAAAAAAAAAGRSSKAKMGRGRGSMGPRDEDDLGDEADLRDVELTPEERERLLEFQQAAAIQCELEFVEGSLDLGEVFRKSFRIYSHGASVDIDPNRMPPPSDKPVMVTFDGTDTLDLPKDVHDVGSMADLEREEKETAARQARYPQPKSQQAAPKPPPK